MFKRNKTEAQKQESNGLTTHMLLQEHDVRGDHLAVAWVDVAPGSCQHPHRHSPEQVYIIVRGRGRMTVGKALQEVREGDAVFIPPNEIHHIENISDETLTYISAATPGFDVKAFWDTGMSTKK